MGQGIFTVFVKHSISSEMLQLNAAAAVADISISFGPADPSTFIFWDEASHPYKLYWKHNWNY